MDKKELYTALAKAQYEMPAINKDSKGNYGYFAKLEDILKIVTPIINKHGLSLIITPTVNEQGVECLYTRLQHISGAELEFTTKLAAVNSNKSEDQQFGGSCTYRTRYILRGLFMLQLHDDLDDDGGGEEYINQEQLDELVDLCAKRPGLEANICKFNKVNNLTDLTERQYHNIIKNLKK